MTAATVRLALNLSQSILSCCLAFWSSAAARPIAKVAADGSTRGADAVECVDGVVTSVSDDGAAITPRRSRPGGPGVGPGAGAGAGAGAAAAARNSRRALRLASCLASPLSSAAASILSISRSARSPFSTQGVHDQFPGFFRWFFEYSSRGSQVPHCAQCFPLVARSAAVTAADILSAAWASRSSRSEAERGGGFAKNRQ